VDICKQIKAALFSRILNGQKAVISTLKPDSETIICKLSSDRIVLMSELIENAKDMKRINDKRVKISA